GAFPGGGAVDGASAPAAPRATPGPETGSAPAVSVVIPARDEEERLGPCLAGLQDASIEVVVVDDRSTDGTAALARAAGARVVAGRELPPGWRGKTWALQQGLEAATGAWVVFLDADVRPRPGLVPAVVAAAEGYDVLSAAPRFVCAGAAERLLHPAIAVTLPLRFGPTDVPDWQPRPARALANGQCLVVRREPFLRAGGWTRVRGHLTEDVALVRAVRRAGGTVGFADAADLLDVRMYRSARETWTGWGRSLMAPDATAPLAQAADVVTLWTAMALPLPRLLTGRGTRLDALLLALRLGLHAALARSYRPRGPAFWLAPLADLPVVGWLSWRAVRPDRRWRGRRYD
ncbi:glycosyltransferase, partial [Patulibacter sp. S7RM1-6]